MSNDQRPSARWSPGGGGTGGLARSGAGGDQKARGAGEPEPLVIRSFLGHWIIASLAISASPLPMETAGARISHHVSSRAPAWSQLGVPECPKPVTDRRSGRSGMQAGGEKCRLIPSRRAQREGREREARHGTAARARPASDSFLTKRRCPSFLPLSMRHDGSPVA